MPRDFQRARIYCAGDLAHAGDTFAVTEQRDQIERWFSQRAMRTTIASRLQRNAIVLVRGHGNRATPETFPERSPQEIHLPPRRRVSQLFLLHELAHCLQSPGTASHGEEMACIWLILTREALGSRHAYWLEDAYGACGVKFAEEC